MLPKSVLVYFYGEEDWLLKYSLRTASIIDWSTSYSKRELESVDIPLWIFSVLSDLVSLFE